MKKTSSNRLASTKQSFANIDQSFQQTRTPLPGEPQTLLQIKKGKNKGDQSKADGKPPSNATKKPLLVKQDKDVISSAKINRKETASPVKVKKEPKDKNENGSQTRAKKPKKSKKNQAQDYAALPNSASLRDKD